MNKYTVQIQSAKEKKGGLLPGVCRKFSSSAIRTQSTGTFKCITTCVLLFGVQGNSVPRETEHKVQVLSNA